MLCGYVWPVLPVGDVTGKHQRVEVGRIGCEYRRHMARRILQSAIGTVRLLEVVSGSREVYGLSNAVNGKLATADPGAGKGDAK